MDMLSSKSMDDDFSSPKARWKKLLWSVLEQSLCPIILKKSFNLFTFAVHLKSFINNCNGEFFKWCHETKKKCESLNLGHNAYILVQ